MLKRLLPLLLLLCSFGKAQSFYRLDPPAPGAVFRICSVTDSNPCTTPQPIFSDQGLTQQITQPVQLGPDGNYAFWTNPGQYVLQIASPFNRIQIINLAGPNPSGNQQGTSSIIVSPNPVPFGTTQSLQFSQPRIVTISNTGSNAVTITGVNIPFPFSNVVNPNPCLISIPAGGVCAFNVQYQPQSPSANDTATLTVSSTAPVDPNNPPQVTLTGSGNASSSFTVSVTVQGTGSVSDGGSLLCPVACQIGYASGTNITLTPTAGQGFTFAGFSGGTCTGTAPCNFNVTQNQAITATFTATPPVVTVSLIAAGQGTGTTTTTVTDVNTGQTVNCGQQAGVQTSAPCQISVVSGTPIVFTGTPALSGVGSCIGGACTGPTWVGVQGCSNASTCSVTPTSNVQLSVGYAQPASGASFAHVQNIPGGTAGTNNVTGLWTAAQNSGDTIILHVLTNSAATTVSSVTDTSGNTYTAPSCGATNPTAGNGFFEALYFASNIAAASANTNTTTVALNASPTYRAIFAEELSGLLASPLDVCKAANGAGAAVATGAITTTAANDYVTGADVIGGHISAASTGFTQLFTSSGNDSEYQTNAAIGSYNFQPTQTGTGFAAIIASWKTTTAAGTQISVNYICAPGSTGSGSVVGSGVNLTCTNGSGPASQVTIGAGSTLTTNATPQTGSNFVTYSGGNCGASPQCTTAALTTNTTISVNFSNSGQLLYFVNTSTGSDANDGLTPTTSGGHGPWKTFAHATSSAKIGANGTIITFAAGAYNEVTTLPQGGSSPTARLALICATPWTVGGSNCLTTQINTYNVNNVDIGQIGRRGFEITQPGGIVGVDNVANGCTAPCNAPNGNSIHVIGNYIHDIATSSCPSSGAILAGQHGVRQTDFQAVGNQIDNIGHGTSCNTMQGIYTATGGAIVTDNIITRVADGAIQYYDQACNAIISNNVLAANHIGLILYGANNCAAGVAGLNTVTNNVIVNNAQAIDNGFTSPAGDCSSGHPTLFSNNDLFGNTTNFAQAQPACETRQNQVSENPTTTFVSYTGDATGNYALQSGSIAKNGGTTQCVPGGTSPCAPAFTFDNAPNPVGTAWNIGAK